MVRSRTNSRVQRLNEAEHENGQQEPLLAETAALKPAKNQPEPFKTKTFLLAALFAFGLFLLFFSLAPNISVFFPPASSIKTSSSRRPTTKLVKPDAPPGSITDKIEHWADQGGSYIEPSIHDTQIIDQAPFFNGTHHFKKTVIIVSLDGFRAEYLKRNLTPRLTRIAESLGISSDYLEPVFPTLTFPNHWSILTGLYPETHGIIGNDFRDPKLDKSFSNVDPHKSWDPIWWFGEPIWAIATKLGRRTAFSMWPGPPYTSENIRPTYWRAFEDRYKWWKKIRQLENWLDLPVKERPELIGLYVPDVDQMGHQYGTTDLQFNKSLTSVDQFIGSLYDSLKARNLTDIVDVVIVGDHGMMDTSDQRIVYLDKVLGSDYFNQIQFQDGWPAAGLRFAPEVNTAPILARLIEQSKVSPGFDVYTHKTMPERWHFTQNDRIAPIYVFPKPGWVISNTNEHQVVMNGTYNVKGVHGYDNLEETMRSIFIGFGPFATQIKTNQLTSIRSNPSSANAPIIVGKIPKFSNLEIFSLVSKLLDLDSFIDFHAKNCSIGFWNQYF
ncbi:hypothetical protein MJO28_001437 [Puccinia striiformis f. sp. tritici]|uniref:Uncharacterized protein n=1 Tax=Puccinia striiformis f. sp. tritici TaxID=168172 RepID=A0ACC0EVS2_9BASI|nr:hypothetical protein MJO28_001437 [Puccinia striiformis f. sp. tritici]KAI9620612.1 hypothetical protein KEM48_008151 [Puccinia striiformis f. sp. tritici PST-130]